MTDPRHPYAEIIHMWLWWSVFVLGQRAGQGTIASFRAAQSATDRLYK